MASCWTPGVMSRGRGGVRDESRNSAGEATSECGHRECAPARYDVEMLQAVEDVG